MRPVTGRFLASLRHPHLSAARCDLLFPGETVPVELPVTAGQITIDRTSSSRRSGSVTVPWSLQAGADLGLDLRTLPLGGYAIPRRGIRYADGTLELVSLGMLRVESVTWQTLEGAASLELTDRMSQVNDEVFQSPHSPATGTDVTRTGTLTHNSPVVTAVTPNTTGLLVGMNVSGPGIPLGARILSVDSASQVTLTVPAQITTVKTSPAIWAATRSFEVSDTQGLYPGMRVYATGFQDGEPNTQWPPPPGAATVVSVDSSSQVTVNVNAGINTSFDCTVEFTLTSTTQTLTFGGGKRIADAAIEIVQQVFGTSITYVKLYDPPIITSDVYYTGSRADAVRDLANAAAAQAYFDANGAFVFDRPPNLDADPVWVVDAGETGVLVNADESLDRTGVANGVLVQGQQAGSDPPVSVLVVDDDPLSPTRWGGPFGKVTRVETSTAVQTAAQAEAAGQSILDRQLGLTRSLTITGAPNPALEAGDLVQVVFSDGRDESHIVDVVNVDLGTGAQQLVTRSVYTPAAGTRQLPAPARRRYSLADEEWRQARVNA